MVSGLNLEFQHKWQFDKKKKIVKVDGLRPEFKIST